MALGKAAKSARHKLTFGFEAKRDWQDELSVNSNVIIIPEIISLNVNGLLVNPKYPDDLAFALEKILADQSLSCRLGEAAGKTIEQLPSVEDWANSVLKLYEKYYI